jgi:tetratricopeptide (TPR) repeat protein
VGIQSRVKHSLARAHLPGSCPFVAFLRYNSAQEGKLRHIYVSMQEQLRAIETLAANSEVKKADIMIARLLRSNLHPQERGAVLRCRARVRLISARPDDALEDLKSADDLDPQGTSQPGTLELRADCHFARFELASVGFTDRNDILEAHHVYTELVTSYPQFDNIGWIYYQLGRTYLADNNFTQAEIYFQQALVSSSQFSYLTAYCFERLGFIAYYDRRDLERALSFLTRAIDTYPQAQPQNWLVQVRILRSRVLKGMHRYTEAIEAASAALEGATAIRPEDKLSLAEALFTMAELTSEITGNERKTISYLSQFLQVAKRPQGVDVTWSRVYEMLGHAYFGNGQYDDAITAFRSALNYNPDHPWGLSLYYRIACSHYHKREYNEVVAAIERMLQNALKDNHAVEDYRVYDLLGNALLAQHRYTDAVDAYANALRLAPPNANSSYRIKSYHDLALELM